MKLWSGRFNKAAHPLLDEYNASIAFDYKLADYDIVGSVAHVMTLKQSALLTEDEASQILQGLQKVEKKVKQGLVNFSTADEDIHTNIEQLLHQEIGDLAKKLHTGRSRNDQVALDMHLYLRQQVLEIVTLLAELLQVIHTLATQHKRVSFRNPQKCSA